MEKVLISACLLGHAVRYDGKHKQYRHPVLQRWLDENRIVPYCPEVGGGLPVPRARAEIADGAGGFSVVDGKGKVIDITGGAITAAFIKGAERAVAVAKASDIHVAVLKEGSPSCGSGTIYNGTFSGRIIPGVGVTTALLQKAGILVFSELEFEKADQNLGNPESKRNFSECGGLAPQQPF